MPEWYQDEAFGAVTAALAAKGINIGKGDLIALNQLANAPGLAGISINTTVTIQIINGSGSWSGSYPTCWFTISGTLEIVAPNNSDNWHVEAMDTYENKPIYDGNVVYGQKVSINYSTGFKIDVTINVTDLSEQYNGSLSVQVSLSL
jgi:hypothetical protein